MSNRLTDRQGRIRLGMVGGGEEAFIGAVHRIAARIDGHYELVAGALSSEQSSRVPALHPEGYLEAFGNLYADSAEDIIARRTGRSVDRPRMATINDGVAGLAFIEAAIRSSSSGGAWIRL